MIFFSLPLIFLSIRCFLFLFELIFCWVFSIPNHFCLIRFFYLFFVDSFNNFFIVLYALFVLRYLIFPHSFSIGFETPFCGQLTLQKAWKLPAISIIHFCLSKFIIDQTFNFTVDFLRQLDCSSFYLLACYCIHLTEHLNIIFGERFHLIDFFVSDPNYAA